MGVHPVGGETDPVGDFGLPFTVCLCGDIFADHAARFPDIDLVRPVVRPDILVLRETPALHLVLEDGRYPGIRHIEIQQSQGVVLMGLQDLLPLFPGRLRISVVHADHIRGERSAVVDVRLVVGHAAPDEIVVQDWVRVGLEHADEQLVDRGIVTFRAGDRHLVLRYVRQADTVVVGLDVVIPGAVRFERPVADAPEQSAAWVAGLDEGVDPVDELMHMPQLGTVVGLTVFRVVLPSHAVADPGLCHEVALVGAVDELVRLDRDRVTGLVGTGDGQDTGSFLLDGLEIVSLFERDERVVEIFHQDFFRDVGLEQPLLQFSIVFAQFPVELPGQTDDGLLVADIGLAETTGGHATDGHVRTDDDDAAAFMGCGIRCRDTGGRTAVDAHGIVAAGSEQETGHQDKQKMELPHNQ